MNTEIKTNQLQYTIDRNRFEERFDLFYLETSERYIKCGAYILDIPEYTRDIKAVKFESGKRVFLLMQKNPANLERLKQHLSSLEEGENYAIGMANLSDMKDYELIQLLLNSLGSYDSDRLKYNNLTGHLYCFHEDWIKHGTSKGKRVIWSVPCLEISVNKALCLSLSVRTFSSELLRNKMTFKKKQFEDYPKYIFAANNTLRRRLKQDDDPCLILRQCDHRKTSISFMETENQTKFEASKMGVLNHILKLFHEKYGSICQLSFRTVPIIQRLDSRNASYLKKENKLRVKSILKQSGIHIVDAVGDEISGEMTEALQELLHTDYDLNASVGKRVSKNKLNIMVIHNSEYYDGNKDPHEKVYAGIAVQHITIEHCWNCLKNALAAVLHNVVIKQDILDGNISLFDWKELGFHEPVLFGLEQQTDEGNRYFFMDVMPDGSFQFTEQELTLFDMNEYSKIAEIFEQGRTDTETVKGIIRYANGDTYAIKDSGLFTIPEIQQIEHRLIDGDHNFRNKSDREALFRSCLDIKLYEDNGRYYYFTGTIGDGMKFGIQHAAQIRRIEGIDGAEVHFEEMLPLMNVSFVRNGQLTVVPFPFKYLREYISQRT